MSVKVHKLRSVLAPGLRDSADVPFTDGATVDQFVPEGFGFIMRNARRAKRTDLVADGDHITYSADLRDPIVTPILFAAQGAVAAGVAGAAAFVLPTWAVYAGMMALSFLASKFLAPSLDPATGKGESKSYSFSGIGNGRAEGETVPVVYGEMRVGGQVIGEYIKSDSDGSTYNALICVGEGPVHAIGDVTTDTTSAQGLTTAAGNLPVGMQINDNPITSFKDIHVHVRLGTLSQTAIPGWEGTPTQFSVALGLVNDETNVVWPAPATINETNYYGQAGGVPSISLAQSDAEWDEWGQKFDITIENDRTEIVLHFPRGLTRSNDSGNLITTGVRFAVRYIELDVSDNPIATGGPEGDGYVRLSPTDAEFGVQAATRSPLFHTFKVPLVKAANYTHPVFGDYAACTGANDFGKIASLAVPAYITATGAGVPVVFTNGFSVGGWFRNTDASVWPSATESLSCISWQSPNIGGIPEYGFSFGVKFTGGFQASTRVPYAQFLKSGSGFSFYEAGAAPVSDMSDGEWHHIVWVYDRQFGGEVVCYFDGVQLQGTLNNIGDLYTPAPSIIGAAPAPFYIGNNFDEDLANSAKVDLDEVFFCDRNLDVLEVLNIYNNGEGVLGSSASIPSAVAIWRFDSASPFTSEVAAFTNTLVSTNGWATSSGGKVLSQGAVEDVDRMKVRMEVLRISPSSTNTKQQSECDWFALTGIIDEEFVYPGRAYYSIEIPASEQLNTSSPKITVPVRGRTVNVWDGVSLSSPVLTPTYTPNIAWIALDLVLDQFYGLGAHYKLADIDLQSVLDWANYSDEMVYDLLDQYDADDRWSDMKWTQTGVLTGGVRGTLLINMMGGGYDLFTSRYALGHYIGLDGVNLVSSEVNTPTGNTLTEELPTINGAHVLIAVDPVAETITLEADLAADPWTSGTYLVASVGAGNVTGTLEGREQRHEWNGVLDTEGKGWPTLQGICGIGFAVPVRQGAGLRFKFEHPRSAIDIVNQASIVRDSFVATYGGASDRPNVKTVDFVDRRLNWERSATRVEHSSIQSTTSLANYRKTQGFAHGITTIRQARVSGLFELNIFNDVLRQGSFGLAADALPYDVGDVLIVGHDLMGWGVSGRIDVEDTAASVKLDQDVTMASGSTYEVHVRDSITGSYEVAAVDHTVHVPPVTVTNGNAITLATGFAGFVPAKDDLYVFVAIGDDTPVVVTGWTRNQDLSHTVDWVEYKSSVFDFTGLEEAAGQESARVAAPNNQTIPPLPKSVEVRQATTNTAGGYTHTITASWRFYDDPDARVMKFNVYIQRGDRRAKWEKVASTDGSQNAVSFTLHGADQNEHISLSVQPMSHSGAGFSPGRSTAVRFVVNIVAQQSGAPTDLAAKMNGNQTIYSWTSTSDEEPPRTVIRRGGWILGQPVGSVDAGVDILKTRNWASGDVDADGRKAPTIYARHINGGGAASEAATLEYDAAGISDRPLGQFAREAYAWHTAAWTGADGDSVPPVKTNLSTATDWEGRSYFEFSGSNLTASYETSIGATSDQQKSRRCTVEAFAEAMQDYPATIESYGDYPAAGFEFACLTAEGWISRDRTRAADCTLKLLISVDGGAFVDFSPGRFSLTSATIKVEMTRPDTSYNLRLYRLHTRVRWVRLETTDRSQVQAATEARVFGR